MLNFIINVLPKKLQSKNKQKAQDIIKDDKKRVLVKRVKHDRMNFSDKIEIITKELNVNKGTAKELIKQAK
ncbi:hypothetical protein FD06_GL001031 [Apilactobacillus ozensis DSM 23829 = JCM 17196]|uniref:Uncharacterized protein n=1 Tax=Apilactobacillus ozensis DSM 23829 = JCM 17196 TaxID=1423781 RepID=A0A0R2ARS4_9LACO|nr:hypothetical protein [Apilactobacillus ozensis]KRM69543.1 hypothetical protein FD06_GL001031 [Apilactobacillus ozensis DSM 23829 = JCM 17196]